jgi:hypothetical protein
MNNTEIQLGLLHIPPRIYRHLDDFSIEKMNQFTDKYTSNLISNYGLVRVQRSIDFDNDPYDPIINYLTSLMQIAILHELFFQCFSSNNEEILSERLELLAWIVNISVATELKIKGVVRIPSIANGAVNIYYTWDNMEAIIRSIMPIINQIGEYYHEDIGNYINELISIHLE